ncbi:MAG: DUF4340 domain-containing protein [Thermoguttaceae bacterium]|nr:DUF4340 domain-containing protein [Thermoguttaceae bacterium]
MKEFKKTLLFVILAVAAAGASWYVNRPIQTADSVENGLGTQLFPDFKNPNDATSLEIVKYNSQTSEKSSFQVKQVNNRWSIPTHDNYPTDAQTQLVEAASDVMGLEILNQVSTDSGDQETYGVVDPDEKDLPPGSRGVGTKVVLRNAHGDVLLGLIIGDSVKNTKDQRYVRRVGQNPIFTTKIYTDKLSTNFGDWIEKDLLQIDVWDIKSITVNDLALKIQNGEPYLRDNGMMKFAFDDQADPSWSLEDMTISDKNGKLKQLKLRDDEGLDVARIGRLAQALDDLKIVDVRRKSDAFSKSLKQTGSYKVDVETQADLISKGFCLLPIPVPGGGEQITLLSTDGDITVDMGNGVEYILRFGAIADNVRSDKGESTVNRYLFVMVQFNPDGVKKPELAPIPEAPNENSPDAAAVAEMTQKIADVKAANEKKTKQYEAALAKAKEKVEKLNKRFADWYYIIDDEEYKKIHISRKDVIAKKSELVCPECGEAGDHDHNHAHDHAHEHAAEEADHDHNVQPQPTEDNPNPPELNLDEYESPELEDLPETVTEEPKVEEPKAEEPKPEQMTTDEPKTEEPKAESAVDDIVLEDIEEAPAPEAEQAPAPQAEEKPTPAPEAEQKSEPTPAPEAEPSPAPQAEEKSAPAPEAEQAPAPEAKETPAPEQSQPEPQSEKQPEEQTENKP